MDFNDGGFYMAQNRTVRIVIGLAVLGALVAAVVFGYIWFSGGSGVSSTPVSAPTLEAETADGETRTLFRIVAEESEVRFILNEELMGNPTEVVGITDQVAGDMLVDFETPANSEVGTIRIDMATIATNNEMRNRAIRGQILQSTNTDFQYAEFTPTAVSGLPETVTVGEAFTFQITGDLTVRGVTRADTVFDVTVTPVSETRLEGSASTQVLYTDFDMSIPNAPGVANVTEEVALEIDFVATVVDAAAADADAAPEATEGS
jgi:polyisoprenoid-binding protein YceI